ncbi:glutathione S-transferase N-terminal domain-containing protein [Saliphagus infecundisoli]|uniref:Glutathione S-transferase N-terminal domain-containing protein n=1 Tax=Saliphagus infecundisoli TaxID=1849069 RepID=A0ABD5QK99_9EURY|nr:glutathione S-transferase N-terminal domain-containing protein [Saliphagus infecundisoli]
MAEITFYELPGCPFCAKVRSKLEELDLEYDSIEVPRAHGEREQVKEVSGQTGVPVLTDEAHGVEGMPESSDIVEYLEETYGSGAA